MSHETYIGDGLYASFDGYQIRLRAPREGSDHVVYLDNATFSLFMDYVQEAVGIKIEIIKADGEKNENV